MLARWYADLTGQIHAHLRRHHLSPEDIDQRADLPEGTTARMLDPAQLVSHVPLHANFQAMLEHLYPYGGTLLITPARPKRKRHPRPKQLTLPLDTKKI